MSAGEKTLHEVIADFKALLLWQKRLGAPGVPYDWIRERQKAAKAAAPEGASSKESLLPPLAQTQRVAAAGAVLDEQHAAPSKPARHDRPQP